jgi:hypothetical protein
MSTNLAEEDTNRNWLTRNWFIRLVTLDGYEISLQGSTSDPAAAFD